MSEKDVTIRGVVRMGLRKIGKTLQRLCRAARYIQILKRARYSSNVAREEKCGQTFQAKRKKNLMLRISSYFLAGVNGKPMTWGFVTSRVKQLASYTARRTWEKRRDQKLSGLS